MAWRSGREKKNEESRWCSSAKSETQRIIRKEIKRPIILSDTIASPIYWTMVLCSGKKTNSHNIQWGYWLESGWFQSFFFKFSSLFQKKWFFNENLYFLWVRLYKNDHKYDHGLVVRSLTKNFWSPTPLLYCISVGHQQSKYVTNIEIQSPTSTNRHQLYFANITIGPTSLSPKIWCPILEELSLIKKFLVSEFLDHFLDNDLETSAGQSTSGQSKSAKTDVQLTML